MMILIPPPSLVPTITSGLQPLTPEPGYDQGMILQIPPPEANAAIIAANEASRRGIQVVSAFAEEDELRELHKGRASDEDGGSVLDDLVMQSLDKIPMAEMVRRSLDKIPVAEMVRKSLEKSPQTKVTNSSLFAPTAMPLTSAQARVNLQPEQQPVVQRMASYHLKGTKSVGDEGPAPAAPNLLNIDLGGNTFTSDAEIGSLIERLSKQSSHGRLGGGLAAPLVAAVSPPRDLSTIFSTYVIMLLRQTASSMMIAFDTCLDIFVNENLFCKSAGMAVQGRRRGPFSGLSSNPSAQPAQWRMQPSMEGQQEIASARFSWVLIQAPHFPPTTPMETCLPPTPLFHPLRPPAHSPLLPSP